VAGDNTISYHGRAFQILPNQYRLSYCKAKVKVHEYLDGRINIFYQGKRLKSESGSKWTQTDIKGKDQILQLCY